MISAPILAWFTVAAGAVIALVLGWRAPKGLWVTVGILFVDAIMGAVLSFVLYQVFAICLKAGFCAQTNDQTVWSLAFPIMFVPVYWLATLLAKASQFWKPSGEGAVSKKS